MAAGLQAHGVAAADAPRGSVDAPPVSVLFAAFLGYNPIQHLVGAHVLRVAAGPRPGGRSPAAASSRS